MKLLPQLINKITRSNPEWEQIIKWFKDVKPEDRGMQFVHDSLFTDKYLWSFHMYSGMLKYALYLYKSINDKNFKYEYSSERVSVIDNFFKTQYKLTQGTFNGRPFHLEPNQVYKLSLLYGFSKKESYMNKEEKGKGPIFMVDKFYDVETRKNGKSEFFAGLANFLVLNPFGNDHQPEVYATGPKQAASKIIYDKAQALAKKNPVILNEFAAINLRRFETHSKGVIKDLPFEKDALEGRNPSFAIATEYHLHKSDTMIDSIESASNLSRINSLLVFDTTKGEGIYGVAYNREYDYKQITLEQLENPNQLIGANIATFMAEVDEKDMPEDIQLGWEYNPLRKSTPMLGVTISLESLQKEWEIAKRNPTTKREFLIKKFGKWIGNMQSLFTIDDLNSSHIKWKDKIDISDLNNGQCLMAIDLANTGDTNAVTLIFKHKVDEVEIPIFLSKIFIPEQTMYKRIEKEKKPYEKWIEEGWVETCGQASVDHAVIASYIKDLMKQYNVKKILYDPYQFHIIKSYLQDIHGISKINFEEVPQNAKTLSSTMEDLIKKSLDSNIFFFGNQAFIDHFVNMKPRYNSQGQIYWTKQSQEQRVDIFATCVTGMTQFSDLPVYSSEGAIKMGVWSW